MVIRNLKMFARGIDAIFDFKLGGVDPQVYVGHKCTEQQNAIALLDVLGDIVASHGSLV